jgi:hypothetical protein
MRQVAWEERHRMVPIRDSLNITQNEDFLLVSQEQEDQIFDTLVVGSPPQGLSPTYSRRTSVATATRRPSAAGSGYQTPLNRHDKYRRRRSVSPMEKDTLYRLVSPRGYDDDQVSLSGTQVYGWEERIHSPTLFGLDEDVLDIIPVPYSRRQSFDRLRSPRLSIAPGHRELQTYYSESDPTPYLRQLAQQYSQERERRLSQQFPDGQPLTLPPETERGDTDSITSEVGPPDPQF